MPLPAAGLGGAEVYSLSVGDRADLLQTAADRLTACEIDRSPRGKPKASDHTPIWCELADEVPGAHLT